MTGEPTLSPVWLLESYATSHCVAQGGRGLEKRHQEQGQGLQWSDAHKLCWSGSVGLVLETGGMWRSLNIMKHPLGS